MGLEVGVESKTVFRILTDVVKKNYSSGCQYLVKSVQKGPCIKYMKTSGHWGAGLSTWCVSVQFYSFNFLIANLISLVLEQNVSNVEFPGALKHGQYKDSVLFSYRPVVYDQISGHGAGRSGHFNGPVLTKVLSFVSVTKAVQPPLKWKGPMMDLG